MVQVGTAEDIVMNPADEYVADFVSGISRFKVIRANAIMVDVQTYEKEYGTIPKGIKIFQEAEKLDSILKYAANTEEIIGIMNDKEQLIGIIDRSVLLKEIIEGASEDE